MTEVSCVTCHRREHWDGPEHHVVIAGGLRRPTEAPALAAWRVIARSLAGELGPVAGECAGCGMPLTGPPGADLATWSWRFDLPDGPLTVDGGRLSPPMAPADVTARLEALHRRGWDLRPTTWLFQGCLIAGMLVPIALWVFGAIYTAAFLINYW